MTFLEIQTLSEVYTRRTENEIRQSLKNIGEKVKRGHLIIQTMHNRKIFDAPYSVDNWSFQSYILALKEYDTHTKEIIDARDKRKDKSLKPIGHDEKTLAVNRKRFFESGVDDEFTEDYIENGGENVETMFGQFWFNTYHKTGFTITCKQTPNISLRGVIMLDKEAFDSIDGSVTSKRNFLKAAAQELMNNMEQTVLVGKCSL